MERIQAVQGVSVLVRLSIRHTPNLTKDERGELVYFHKYIECQFSYLTTILAEPYNYSPFNFIGYRRGTHNICSDAFFVVIDIDHTSLSIHEQFQHLTSEGLQCILATTSDSANLHKYRAIIPLTEPVSAIDYRRLVMGIREFGLIPDLDPASFKPAQQFYSYTNSIILSDFTGIPLNPNDYFVELTQAEQHKLDPPTDITQFLHTLESYRFATKGRRTRSLLSVGYKCLEEGLTDAQLEQAVFYVNSMFLVPKDTDSVYRRVINFIKSQRGNL